MNMKNTESFIAWLREQASACRSHQAEKFADDRKDEGIFETIRANVYEIFIAIASTAVKIKAEEEIYPFLAEKQQSFKDSWEKSMILARQHDDAKKVQTEGIKLETLDIIRAHAESLWGQV